MADYNSSLPVRSEADVDERVQVKIVDTSTPSQQMTVDTDNNAHVEMHGNDPSGTDTVLKTSEDGSMDVDGLYSITLNTEPANIGLIAAQRAASPGDSDQIKRLTAITNSTVHALDISLHDEAGEAYSATNPLHVVMLESEGTEINDYQTSASLAAGASVDLDYTVTALKTLQLTQFHGSASGKAKFEVKTETGVGSGTFNTKFVFFNSTATPNVDISLKDHIQVAAGVKVRVTITNRDNQAQDVYSTISGHEV
jgi:hypothetical protein